MDASIDDFVAESPYTHPVDLKKLRFIYDALTTHVAGDHAGLAGLAGLAVLEVGCGVGNISLPMAALGCRVTGIDVDPADAAELREKAAARGFDHVEVIVGDALTWRSDQRYDAVVASEVFEHLDEPRHLAAMIARHIKPGGLLIVTTPNGFGPWETMNTLRLVPRRWNWLRSALRKPPQSRAGREHEQRYTRARLIAMFAGEGFRLLRWSNSDFVFTISRGLRASPTFGALDCKIGELVPHWMASGWYMTFTYDGGHE